ncbi:MAG: tetratricopeptide repeat protein [Ignavibacteriaceae bacterium]
MKSILSILVLLLAVGCSPKKSDKDLLDEAKKNLKEHKISEAVMAFEELVNDNPESKLAPEALSELAAIYQNKLVKSLSEKENFEKAVTTFKKIHTLYPKSEFAPSGLFMAAFISANELKNFDEATSLYKLFLQEYPGNELTASAQAELDNMGLSPEEILQKNMAKEK